MLKTSEHCRTRAVEDVSMNEDKYTADDLKFKANERLEHV